MIFLLIISDDGKAILCEVHAKYFDRMLFAAVGVLGKDQGEDAVHDVFVKIIKLMEKNSDFLRDKTGQYFVTMVKNHCINLSKRNRIDSIPLDEDMINEQLVSKEMPVEESIINTETVDMLAEYIRQLTPETRQVLEYKYIEGYGNIEIAGILNISQSAVSSRVDRGLKRLRMLLVGKEMVEVI